MAKAAKIYGIPYVSLYDRKQGALPRAEANSKKKKLTTSEEEVLIQRILSLDKRGFPPRPIMIEGWANLLLANRDPSRPIECVGINWKSTFISCYPELKSRYSRRFNCQWALCEDPATINKWFNHIKTIISEPGILDKDIYNFDETGFVMGLILAAKVITGAKTCGKPQLIQPGNYEWVISIETINAEGWCLPPYIIFKAKNKQEGWFNSHVQIKGMRINTSENRWTTDSITFNWLKNHFIPYINLHIVGRYCLLILDGHGSHLTPEFNAACSKNHIISVCMPAYSFHLC